jgi:hypothetical protein
MPGPELAGTKELLDEVRGITLPRSWPEGSAEGRGQRQETSDNLTSIWHQRDYLTRLNAMVAGDRSGMLKEIFSSLASTLAPRSSRSCTTASCPSVAAINRGV